MLPECRQLVSLPRSGHPVLHSKSHRAESKFGLRAPRAHDWQAEYRKLYPLCVPPFLPPDFAQALVLPPPLSLLQRDCDGCGGYGGDGLGAPLMLTLANNPILATIINLLICCLLWHCCVLSQLHHWLVVYNAAMREGFTDILKGTDSVYSASADNHAKANRRVTHTRINGSAYRSANIVQSVSK